jgi:hypothetical protein
MVSFRPYRRHTRGIPQRSQSCETVLRIKGKGKSVKASDFLNEAKATIQDRGMEYGHPSDNMSRTACLWSAFLQMPVTDYQVASCMALVKLARSMESGKVDTYIDAAAYMAIAGQLHTEENELYV